MGRGVNQTKSAVDLAKNRKILGYSFWYSTGGAVKLKVAGKALETMKERVRMCMSIAPFDACFGVFSGSFSCSKVGPDGHEADRVDGSC